MTTAAERNRSFAEVKGFFANLLKQWSLFLAALLAPGVVVFGLAAIALLWISISREGSEALGPTGTAVVTVLIALSSALAGGVLARRWDDLAETGILVTRGKSAIRGLRILLLDIGQLELRVAGFLSKVSAEDQEAELFKTRYEELIGWCARLQEGVVNSIEEWTDIIPQADVKTQIGQLSEMRSAIARLQEEREELIGQLESDRSKGAEERGRLERELKAKDRKLRETTERLRAKEAEFSFSGLGGIGRRLGAKTSLVAGTLQTRCQPVVSG